MKYTWLGVLLGALILAGCGSGSASETPASDAKAPAKSADKSGATSGDPVEAGKTFVDAVFKKDLKTLTAMEDSAMQSAMSETAVGTLVSQITAQHGAIKSQGSPRKGSIQGMEIVYVPLTFEKDALDAKVVFNADHKVAGFFFVAPAESRVHFPLIPVGDA